MAVNKIQLEVKHEREPDAKGVRIPSLDEFEKMTKLLIQWITSV